MAQQADGTIYINTAIQTDGFKVGSKELENAVRRTASKISGIGKSAETAMQKQVNAFAKANSAYAQQEQKVESLKNKLKEMSGQKVATDEYKEIGRQIDNDTAKLNRLEKTQEEFLATGGKEKSTAYQKREMQIEELRNSIRSAKNEQDYLLNNGGAYQSVDTSATEQRLANEQEKLRQSGNNLGVLYDSLKSKFASYGQVLRNTATLTAQYSSSQAQSAQYTGFFRSALNGLVGAIHAPISAIKALVNALRTIPKNPLGGLAEKFKSLGSTIRGYAMTAIKGFSAQLLRMTGLPKFFGVIGNLGSSFLGLNKGATSAGASIGNFTGGLKKGIFTVLKYGLGIRSLYVLVNKLRNAMKEGFKNLAQYSGKVNASISSVMSAMTQFKNSVATAFAPLLNVVAPIVTKFINLMSKAMTYVGMFFASLTGQKTFTKAVEVQEDYAASLNDSGKAAKKAKKETQDYLSGLDEVRKFETPDTDDSGSDSGSGGYQAPTPGQMFEEVEIPSLFEDLAEKMKKAWETADFTEIGTMVGTKLKNALDNIPWDKIKQATEKIAKSTATFLNGFFETPGLFDSIGKTAAEGINTGLTFAKTFLDTFHWDSLGKAITTGISSFFGNIDWSLLGGTISSAFQAFFKYVRGLFEGIDWKNLPQAIVQGIKDFFTGFDWKGTFSEFGKLIGTVVASAIDLGKAIWDMLKKTGVNIASYFSKYFEEYGFDKDKGLLENGKAIVLGILNGIIDFFKNIGSWIKEHILDPFIDGFKSTFEINSPSKLPAILELGKNILLGILNGIVTAIVGIGTWIKDNILQPILDGFSNVGQFFKGVGEKIWGAITDAFDAVKKTITATVSLVKDKVFDKVKEAWDSVKDKAAELVANAKEKFAGSLEEIKSRWEFIGDKTAELVASAKERVAGALGTIKNNWEAVKNKTSELIANAKNNAAGVLSTLKSAWETVKNKTSELVGKAKNNSASVLSTLKSAWETIKGKTAELVGKAKNNNATVLSTLKSAWNTIKKKTAQLTAKAVNKDSKVLSALKSAWGDIKDKTVTLTAKIKDKAGKIWSSIKDFLGLSTGGIYKNGKWQPIEGYASGGNPRSARLFYANENGIPELIGRIGHATAVMNNGQIVASVAAGVYQAVVAAFGKLSNYFASISLSLSKLPDALQNMQTYVPVNAPTPVLARGTVIPPQATVDSKSVQQLQQTIDGLNSLINRLNGIGTQKQSGGQNNTYTFIGQINRRTLFEEIMDEAQLVRHSTGRNPFEMA